MLCWSHALRSDQNYWVGGFDPRNGRGSDTQYGWKPRELSRERGGDTRRRERSRTGTQSPKTTSRISRPKISTREREWLKTSTDSPRMKRIRKAETSARSVTESSSHQASWSAA